MPLEVGQLGEENTFPHHGILTLSRTTHVALLGVHAGSYHQKSCSHSIEGLTETGRFKQNQPNSPVQLGFSAGGMSIPPVLTAENAA